MTRRDTQCTRDRSIDLPRALPSPYRRGLGARLAWWLAGLGLVIVFEPELMELSQVDTDLFRTGLILALLIEGTSYLAMSCIASARAPNLDSGT